MAKSCGISDRQLKCALGAPIWTQRPPKTYNRKAGSGRAVQALTRPCDQRRTTTFVPTETLL